MRPPEPDVKGATLVREVPPQKTLMTEEETALISESWDLVRQDLKGHGLKFFKQ